MPSIADTIRALRRGQASGPRLDIMGGGVGLSIKRPSRLVELSSFGTNPGDLSAWYYAGEAGGLLPLVVVLHGCTQNSVGYDHGAGWSDLAERFGFAVLYPEQRRGNNANLCFNWFLDEDIRRDHGEALSIRQMIGAMVARLPIDPARVFVTGLSAGGAMANVMLATYPEVFAGGSIIAGLPYGAANSVPQALERMRGAGHPGPARYGDLVRSASPHRGRWPRVTVWHGDADRTVVHGNAGATLAQWRNVHGLDGTPQRVETVDGQRHRVWLDAEGRVAVDEYVIAGLGHGTPLRTVGRDGCGNAGPHMLEAGISSTWRQAESWGLVDRAVVAPAPAAPSPPPEAPVADDGGYGDVRATIEGALRSAGLMR